MMLYNFSPDAVNGVMRMLNNEKYATNLRFDETSRRETAKGWRIRGVLRAANSFKHGARTAASGRHMPCASWEAHRDFMRSLFQHNPNGRIQTALADYRGVVNFEAKFPATAHHNVGSQMQPRTIAECSV